MPRPLIVTVERHRLEDGPGIRSVVFFKGCPLRCVFCHNPESQLAGPEVLTMGQECLRCCACVEACPKTAISAKDPNKTDRSRCVACGLCVSVCPGRGRQLIGRYVAPEELAELLLRDLRFYNNSGGGVTFSGGECLVWPGYLGLVARRLRERDVHLTVETAGCFDFRRVEKDVLPYLSLVYFDLKFVDEVEHRRFTGQSNRRILENLRRLLRIPNLRIHPRVPLIPAITTRRDNIAAVIAFLLELGVREVTFLRYNPVIANHSFEALSFTARIGEEMRVLEFAERILERAASCQC